MCEGAADQTCVNDVLIHRKVLQKLRLNLVELVYHTDDADLRVRKLWGIIADIDKAVGFAFLSDMRTK